MNANKREAQNQNTAKICEKKPISHRRCITGEAIGSPPPHAPKPGASGTPVTGASDEKPTPSNQATGTRQQKTQMTGNSHRKTKSRFLARLGMTRP